MAHCTESINRGLLHTKRLLFHPFRISFWLKLTLILFIIPGLNILFQTVIDSALSPYFSKGFQNPPEIDLGSNIAAFIPLFMAGFMVILIFQLSMSFLTACVNILFYEGVWKGQCSLVDNFLEHLTRIFSYFLWNIVIGIITLILGGIVFLLFGLGTALIMAATNETVAIVVLVTVGAACIVVGCCMIWIYHVLISGLVLPRMIVKKEGILSAWGQAIDQALSNLFEFFGYVLIRFIVGFLYALLFFVMMLIFQIPGLLLGFAGITTASVILTLASGFFTFIVLFGICFVFLPIPTFINAYNLCFVGFSSNDPDYEPKTGLAPTPPQASHPATPPPSMSSTTVSQTSGPVHFRDIPKESDAPSVEPFSIQNQESVPESETPGDAPMDEQKPNAPPMP
jgi:hypothetical protein